MHISKIIENTILTHLKNTCKFYWIYHLYAILTFNFLTGIGFETARSLAKHGCTVIFACRNESSAQEAINKIKEEKPTAVCEIICLDLASLSSVLEASKQIKEKYKRIDMLILNAGVFGLPFSRTADGFETTFQVNHLSQFYLTLLLKPLLKTGSRVVIISSESHRYLFILIAFWCSHVTFKNSVHINVAYIFFFYLMLILTYLFFAYFALQMYD